MNKNKTSDSCVCFISGSLLVKVNATTEASVVALTLTSKLPEIKHTHESDVLFLFILWGEIKIQIEGKLTSLDQGDSISIPRNTEYRWQEPSDDLEILEICLPAQR